MATTATPRVMCIRDRAATVPPSAPDDSGPATDNSASPPPTYCAIRRKTGFHRASKKATPVPTTNGTTEAP